MTLNIRTHKHWTSSIGQTNQQLTRTRCTSQLPTVSCQSNKPRHFYKAPKVWHLAAPNGPCATTPAGPNAATPAGPCPPHCCCCTTTRAAPSHSPLPASSTSVPAIPKPILASPYHQTRASASIVRHTSHAPSLPPTIPQPHACLWLRWGCKGRAATTDIHITAGTDLQKAPAANAKDQKKKKNAPSSTQALKTPRSPP